MCGAPIRQLVKADIRLDILCNIKLVDDNYNKYINKMLLFPVQSHVCPEPIAALVQQSDSTMTVWTLTDRIAIYRYTSNNTFRIIVIISFINIQLTINKASFKQILTDAKNRWKAQNYVHTTVTS